MLPSPVRCHCYSLRLNHWSVEQDWFNRKPENSNLCASDQTCAESHFQFQATDKLICPLVFVQLQQKGFSKSKPRNYVRTGGNDASKVASSGLLLLVLSALIVDTIFCVFSLLPHLSNHERSCYSQANKKHWKIVTQLKSQRQNRELLIGTRELYSENASYTSYMIYFWCFLFYVVICFK